MRCPYAMVNCSPSPLTYPLPQHIYVLVQLHNELPRPCTWLTSIPFDIWLENRFQIDNRIENFTDYRFSIFGPIQNTSRLAELLHGLWNPTSRTSCSHCIRQGLNFSAVPRNSAVFLIFSAEKTYPVRLVLM